MGGQRQKPEVIQVQVKAGRSKTMLFPKVFTRSTALVIRWFLTYIVQNCEKINCYRCKSPGLQQPKETNTAADKLKQMDVSKLPQREKVKTDQLSKCVQEQRYNRVTSFQNISGFQQGLIQKKRNLTRHLNRDDLMQGIRLYRKWRPTRAKSTLRIQVSSYHSLVSENKEKQGLLGPRIVERDTPGPSSLWEWQQLGTRTNFCYQEGKRAAAENRKSEGRNKVLSPTSRYAV